MSYEPERTSWPGNQRKAIWAPLVRMALANPGETFRVPLGVRRIDSTTRQCRMLANEMGGSVEVTVSAGFVYVRAHL